MFKFVVLIAIILIILSTLLYFSGRSNYSDFISARAKVSDPRMTELEDKVRAPMWVRGLGIPVPEMYRTSSKPKYMQSLYFPYVLKTNHFAGGRGVFVVRNMREYDKAIPALEDLLKRRMTSEQCVKDIEPRLALAEEYIPDAKDMKVYIFNGKARIVVYIKNKIRYWLYPNYTPVGFPVIHAPQVFWVLPGQKPKFWNEIIQAAEKIAANEPKVWKASRLDFMHNQEKYVFGEITFSAFHGKFYSVTFTPFGKKLFDKFLNQC